MRPLGLSACCPAQLAPDYHLRVTLSSMPLHLRVPFTAFPYKVPSLCFPKGKL